MKGKLLLVLVLAATLVAALLVVRSNNNPNASATDEQVQIDLFPKYGNLASSETPTQIWINRNKKVSEAKVTLRFDPDVLQVKGDDSDNALKLNSKNFGEIERATSIEKANETGVMTLKAKVKDGDAMPKGTILFATTTFIPVDDEAEKTTVKVDPEKTKVFNKSGDPLTFDVTKTLYDSKKSDITLKSLGLKVSLDKKTDTNKTPVTGTWNKISTPDFHYFTLRIKNNMEDDRGPVSAWARAYAGQKTSKTLYPKLEPGTYKLVLRAVHSNSKVDKQVVEFEVK